jgi:murein DD-endopeptidase MepM/ murein hydrolase activator NlpD
MHVVRGRRRRLARRVLVPSLTVAIIVSGSIAGFAGVRDDTRLIAAREAVQELERDVGFADAVVGSLRVRVAHVEADLSELRDLLGSGDAELSIRERELERRSELAAEVITTGHVSGREASSTSLRELREPLRLVSEAIRASDDLAVELLGQEGDVQERIAQTRQLLARVRETEFRLAIQERAVRDELAEAVRSAHELTAAAADRALQREAAELIERARAELHEIDVASTELRQREAEVLEQSVSLAERAVDIREGIRTARRRTSDLYAQMAIAEVIVGDRMAAWGDPFDGMTEIALDGVLRVCPVDEPRVYSDNWHAPRWSGGFHLHQGIDIFAPTGTPIRAPFDGLAVTADNTLGGIAVKVYGKAGYVYNAHLSAYGELGRVEAGEIIGYVGNTGNAINSVPHDHFEFHPGDGEAVNPFPFLNAVC